MIGDATFRVYRYPEEDRDVADEARLSLVVLDLHQVASEDEMPKATDKVSVQYKGTLLDGTEFDSSYKRGQPASFPVSGVIKGWTEGLQLMKVGSKYKFFIPAALAYGERGAGKDIGPNSTLIFEVELIGIEPPAPAPAAAPGAQVPAPPPGSQPVK